MTNIVYKMTFLSRISTGTPPYHYIGMKTNCSLLNNSIIDSRGKLYKSSTKHPVMKSLIEIEYPFVEVLFESDDVNVVAEKEREFHIMYNVGRSIDYFNMTISPNSSFCKSGIGTFRHSVYPDVRKRIPVNDPVVLSGEFVGVTLGYRQSEETCKKISVATRGSSNPFYGKSHSITTKAALSKGSMNNKNHWVHSKDADEYRHRVSTKSKNMVSLRSLLTGDRIRVSKSQWATLDKNVWVSINKNKVFDKPYTCTNCGKACTKSVLTQFHNNKCKKATV